MPTHEKDLREQILRIAEQTGAQLTDAEHGILNVFLNTESHITPGDLAALCRDQSVDADEFAVEDFLRKLCRFGAAYRHEFNIDGKIRVLYEHRHLTEHHDHLACVRCGAIMDVYDPGIEDSQNRLCREHGFTPLWHRSDIYGICGRCADRRAALLPLTFATRGERVVVHDIRGGDRVKRRLADLGIIKDLEIEVLNSDGPMLLAVRDARVAIGMGIAGKILVAHARK